MIASPEFVRRVVTDPGIWPFLAEDCDRPEDFATDPGAHYFQHGEHGYMEFRQAGAHWYQVHIAMLRGATGVREFVLRCMAEMRAMGAKRFTAMIAATNRSAIILAYRCGYRLEGRLKGVLLKQGRDTDLIILGAE